MFKYSDEKLAILIGVPIVTFILIWTIAIFHKNRRKWGPYDIVIVSIIVQSILRNLASVIYTSWLVVRQSNMSVEVCSSMVWIFNSVHTFQASSLTTLAVIALFSTKLETKQLSIRQYLMRTHIVYHMFCLTTLCACVGVAAILAQEIPSSAVNSTSTGFDFLKDAYQNIYPQCLFMPFQLDIKYSVFILTLHVFLTVVSASCLLWILIIVVRVRKKNFSYLKKSTSDLSDLSLASMVNVNENLQGKCNYDTYTIHKSCNVDGYGNCCENHCNGHVPSSKMGWTCDPSATVSSSNSRRPCLNGHGHRLKEEDPDGTGLQTMYPVLTVCYLFNHIPVIILCIFPWLIYPWPVAGAALWMAQLQDVLIPIGLGLVDTRFCTWVTGVYKCSDRHVEEEKLPQVGLDGKFRHFESQPQSLEINHPVPERIRAVQHSEHKFPITNGSLYTSIDGRLPIIHNYRRHKNQQGTKGPTLQSANMDIHSSHLKRQEHVENPQSHLHSHNSPISNVPINYCYRNNNSNNTNPSPPKDNNFSNDDIRYRPSFSGKSMLQRIHRDSFILHSRPLHKRISLSHDSVRNAPLMENNWPCSSFAMQNLNKNLFSGDRSSRHGLGLDYRKSKSEDALNDLQKDLQRFKQNPGFYDEAKNGVDFSKDGNVTSCCSSDDESSMDRGGTSGQENDCGSQSEYSITTDGNCDFDFYQNNDRLYNSKSSQSQEDCRDYSYNLYPEDYIRPTMTTFKPIRPQLQSTNMVEKEKNNYDQNRNKNENDNNNNKSNNENPQHNKKISRTSSKSSGTFLDVRLENNNNFNLGRISRSSSKKSLENFHAYVEENIAPRIQRSNSFVTNEYKCKFNLNSLSRLSRSNSILSDCSCVKEVKKSSIVGSQKTSYIEDLFANHGLQVNSNTLKYQNQGPNCSVSVPDFKKIFISEYL